MTEIPNWVRAAWLIPALPLTGAVILLLTGSRIRRASGALATTLMAGSFVAGLSVFFQVIARPAADRTFVRTVYEWIPAGSFRVAADYRIDPLALVMILVVTGVGTLIHLYSTGYMKGDEHEHRYFAYLNLFAFSMLMLVMANNFLVLYFGWEMVGLCSYLLIGFWFERRSAASAAKKAFITNRVGDLAFAVAIMLIFAAFGTLDFGRVFAEAGSVLGTGAATAIALLLFAGAVGKSAQIPLHVWLPDAMEGPTPVSALIHAATMVTAGVYMVARTSVIYELAPDARFVVVVIGAATAIYAALAAAAQDDIKRVLAYSTASQLGFMFVAVGSGEASAGMFHLVTHAFFKALLFLGAGSVIHALAGEQNLLRMGGIWRVVPWTATTFVAGWLAIIAFPGTSGFFSKDEVLLAAYGYGKAFWILLLIATLGTGYYMTRLVLLAFFGRSRLADGVHPHESPPSMVFSLVVLAAAAIIGGLIGAGGDEGALHRFLEPPAEPATAVFSTPSDESGTQPNEGALGGIAAAFSLGGVALAAATIRRESQREPGAEGIFRRAARRGFYVDEAYQFLFTGVGRLAAAALAYFDARIIDGAVNQVGRGFTFMAGAARRLQTGYLRTYALGIVGGGVAILALLLVRTR